MSMGPRPLENLFILFYTLFHRNVVITTSSNGCEIGRSLHFLHISFVRINSREDPLDVNNSRLMAILAEKHESCILVHCDFG